MKIQSKNKCGIICQLFTPLICILIIFGLQKLVDSLNMDTNPNNKSLHEIFSPNKHGINELMKGFQPQFGNEIIKSFNQIQNEWEASNLHFDEISLLSHQESLKAGIPTQEKQNYKFVKAHKVLDDIKVPFNMIVPLNLPIDYKTMKNFLKDQFILRSCYKFFKFGSLNNNIKIQDYLINHLTLENDADLRKTTCTMKKDGQFQPSVKVPNVRHLSNTTSSSDINTRMFEEITQMEKFDLFKIDKELLPSDGYMVFNEANDNKISGTLSANNIQFFAYHHDNYMNMAVTKQFIRVYMNTETYLTMIDIITNNYLLKLQANNLSSPHNPKLAHEFKKMVSSLTLEEIINFRNNYNALSQKPLKGIFP